MDGMTLADGAGAVAFILLGNIEIEGPYVLYIHDEGIEKETRFVDLRVIKFSIYQKRAWP